MDEHEVAWAAGFFDGDGWAALVRYGRGSHRRPMAQINQAGLTGVPEVLVRFRDAVGVGRVAGPMIRTGRHDLYRWVASSRADVARTGELIGPWLSSAKRGQFGAAVGLTLQTSSINSIPWAAGLFDAEGSVSLSDHRSHAGYKAIEASVTQRGGSAAPEELVRFRTAIGMGSVNGPYEQEGARGPVYRWRLHAVKEVRLMVHLLDPSFGSVKRVQARAAIRVIDTQPSLPRGRTDWGSHKTQCIHGHDYASARVRPYLSRGGVQRRDSKQCLVCTREQAMARRSAENKIGPNEDGSTC